MIVLREAVSGAADPEDEQEASILLGRALYVAGRFEDSLEQLRRIAIVDERHWDPPPHGGSGGGGSESKSESSRRAALYAQALVCHAMLLERSDQHQHQHHRAGPPQSAAAVGFPNDPGLPLSLFSRAAQLYLAQVEHTKRAPVQPGASQTSSESDCQYAIHRTIMLLAVAGEVDEALAVAKRCLRTALPAAFRLHILRCASTLLIRTLPKPTGAYGVSGGNNSGNGGGGGGGGGGGSGGGRGSSTARGGGRSAGSGRSTASHFTANTEDEEAILLLLLEVYTLEMQSAAGLVAPSTSAEGEELEEMACRVCNAAWLIMPRHNRYQTLIDVCEKAMMTWHCSRAQFALACALACSARQGRALLVLKQSSSWAARDSDVLLLGAMLHLNEGQHDQCYLLAKEVWKSNPATHHRAQYLMGICKLEESRRPQPIPSRLDIQATALQLLQAACGSDPQSGTYMFNCAVACIEARDMAMAEHYAKKATRLKHGRPVFACLLALVWAARTKMAAALLACQAAADENPDCLLPMQLMSQIVHKLYGAGRALPLHQAVLLELATHRNQAPTTGKTDPHFAGPQYELLAQKSGVARSMSSRDNTASVLSSVLTAHAPARSLSASQSVAESSASLQPHVDVWLEIANCFLELEQFRDCESCIAEARNFGVISADVESCAGLLAAALGARAASARDETAENWKASDGKGEHRAGSKGGSRGSVGEEGAAARQFAKAQRCYDRALAIDPTHAQSLVGQANILILQGFHLNAQAVLEEAVTMDPYCAESWRCLGNTFGERGDKTKQAECLLTALELEATTLPMPLSKLQSSLH